MVGEFFLRLRYHETCFVSVVNPKYLKPKLATNKDANPSDTPEESVIDFVMKEILINQNKIWNSVEIYDVYIEYGGHQYVPSNKNRLMNIISELLHDKVYLFKSTGVATLLMLKQKASNLFQLINCNDNENDIQVNQITGKIKKEIIKLPKVKRSIHNLTKFQCGKVAAKPYYYYNQKFHLHLIRPYVVL